MRAPDERILLSNLRRLFEGSLAIGNVAIAFLSVAIPWAVADPTPGSNNYDDDRFMMKLGIAIGLALPYAAVRLLLSRRPARLAAAAAGGVGLFMARLAVPDLKSWPTVWAMFALSSAIMLLIPAKNPAVSSMQD